jgi:hypothetical protein
VAPNRGVARHLREKLAVFSAFAQSALLARPGFDAGPCIGALARHAATIPWLAVALPSHWAPEHKVGRSFAEVHAPVADSQRIVGVAAHLARLVIGADRWERFVWTITRHPRLHAHPARVHDALASMSGEVLDYRGLAPVRDRLLRWLAARSAWSRQ